MKRPSGPTSTRISIFGPRTREIGSGRAGVLLLTATKPELPPPGPIEPFSEAVSDGELAVSGNPERLGREIFGAARKQAASSADRSCAPAPRSAAALGSLEIRLAAHCRGRPAHPALAIRCASAPTTRGLRSSCRATSLILRPLSISRIAATFNSRRYIRRAKSIPLPIQCIWSLNSVSLFWGALHFTPLPARFRNGWEAVCRTGDRSRSNLN